MKKIIFFILLSNLPLLLLCQEYTYELKNFGNYVEDTRIVDYVIDQEKDIWICNTEKIIKYDGSNVISFNINHKNRTISEIKLVHNEFLLILYSDGSLGKFDIKKYIYTDISGISCLSIYSYNDFIYTLSPGYVVKIFHWNDMKNPIKILKIGNKYNFVKEAPHHQIYVNDAGIFLSIPSRGIYLIKNGKYIPLVTGSRINSGYRRLEKFIEINGTLHYTGLSHIYSFNRKKNRFEIAHKYDAYNSDRISALYEDQDCIIYSNKNYNFIRVIQKNGVISEYAFQDIDKITKIDDKIVVSTRKGLVIINKNNNEISGLNYDELDKFIIKRKILETADKIVFTGYQDILTLDKRSNKLQKIILPNYFPTITDIVDTPYGYFAATEGWGLAQISHEFRIKKILSFDHPIHDKKLYAICYDKTANNLFVGASKYIYYFNLEKTNYKYFQRVKFDFGEIRNVLSIDSSSKLVINSVKGVYLYDVKKNMVFSLIKNIFTCSSFVDHYNKKLWIGSDRSVYIFDLKNTNKYKIVSFKNLHNPTIAAFLQDNYQNIWISTFSSLIKIKPDGSDINTYYCKDGLKNQEFNYKSAVKLKNGQLIFGGISGFDLITPDNKKIAKRKVIVKDILLIGKDTLASKYNNQKISYPIDKYFCRINISSNFFNDKKISYKYKIDDGNWIKVEDRNSIDLIGFAEGNYNITIAGIDNKGTIAKEAVVNICAKEIFYKSRIFLFLALMSFFALVLFLIYFVNKKKNVRRETIEEISMDLHDEVGTLLTKTRLLFELGDKQDESNDKKILEYLNQMNFKFRLYINTVKEKNKDVYELYDTCIDLISQIAKLKNIDFEKKIQVENNRTINSLIQKDIKLSIYEIINNIAKYSSTKKINFELTYTQKIEIQIITSKEKTDFYKNKTTGNGLRNILKRTKKHKGDFIIYERNEQLYYKLTFKT